MKIERETFEKFVEEVLAQIPQKFKKRLHNVVFIVEEKPPAMSQSSPYSTLLGLYHGVPFQHRGPFYGNVAPDVIVIYQQPIENICSTEEELRKRVREVVLHEIGHYFGLSEKELRKIED